MSSESIQKEWSYGHFCKIFIKFFKCGVSAEAPLQRHLHRNISAECVLCKEVSLQSRSLKSSASTEGGYRVLGRALALRIVGEGVRSIITLHSSTFIRISRHYSAFTTWNALWEGVTLIELGLEGRKCSTRHNLQFSPHYSVFLCKTQHYSSFTAWNALSCSWICVSTLTTCYWMFKIWSN